MNRDKFNPQYHAWSEEHITYCTVTIAQHQGNQDVEKVLLNRGDSYLGVPWDHDGFQIPSYRDNSGDWVFPCLVIASDKTNSNLEVILFGNHTSSTTNDSSFVLRHSRNFSHAWVNFRPRQFKGDSMNPLAFRHEIGIPDEAFPEHWKDLLE